MRKKLLRSRSGFEKPESREEAIMQNILGASNVLEPAESNIEEILQAILYNTPYTKKAESEIEKILLAIKNNGTYDGEGESRDIKILIAILNGLDYTEETESRIEELYVEWLQQRQQIKVIEGVPPLSFTAKGKPLTAWSITGNTVQNGTPTPDNPVEVQAVGDRTANLFDILTVYSDTTKFTINKNSVTATGRNFDAKRIKLADVGVGIGDAFVFSANILNSTTTVMGRVCASIGGVIKQGFYKNNVLGPYISSITGTMETNEDAIWISYGNTGEINASNIMLNTGSTPLPYEPYGYKIPVVTRGKNLLEPIGFSATSMTDINDSRNKTNTYGTSLSTVYGGNVLVTQANQSGNTTSYANGFFYIVVDFSKFTTGKNYILSFDYEIKEKHSELVNSIAYIGKGANFVTIDGDWDKDGRKSVKFTVKEGFNPYIEIRLCGNSIFVSNIQIEEGTTATPYEPYHEPITTPIYLPTPLYSGEVMRSDGTITRSDGTTETFTAPQIPTLNGTTVIDVDTAVKPSNVYIEYK